MSRIFNKEQIGSPRVGGMRDTSPNRFDRTKNLERACAALDQLYKEKPELKELQIAYQRSLLAEKKTLEEAKALVRDRIAKKKALTVAWEDNGIDYTDRILLLDHVEHSLTDIAKLDGPVSFSPIGTLLDQPLPTIKKKDARLYDYVQEDTALRNAISYLRTVATNDPIEQNAARTMLHQRFMQLGAGTQVALQMTAEIAKATTVKSGIGGV